MSSGRIIEFWPLLPSFFVFSGWHTKLPIMADRKAELERKKAKLQALREDKERRKREKERKEVSVFRSVVFALLRLRLFPKEEGLCWRGRETCCYLTVHRKWRRGVYKGEKRSSWCRHGQVFTRLRESVFFVRFISSIRWQLSDC